MGVYGVFIEANSESNMKLEYKNLSFPYNLSGLIKFIRIKFELSPREGLEDVIIEEDKIKQKLSKSGGLEKEWAKYTEGFISDKDDPKNIAFLKRCINKINSMSLVSLFKCGDGCEFAIDKNSKKIYFWDHDYGFINISMTIDQYLSIKNLSPLHLGYRENRKLPTNRKDVERFLISIANSNIMEEKELQGWSQTYDEKGRKEKIYNELKNMKLGCCATDAGGNYIYYSFKSKCFYFFDHEHDGLENLEQNKVDLNWIIKYINDYLK